MTPVSPEPLPETGRIETVASTNAEVLLVGYERQENLGLRSLVAYLHAQGHAALILPFGPGQNARILAAVQEHQPRIIGFSIIFQYSLDEFGSLMRCLRDHGVKAHFTAGGHFPTLRPEETFKMLPELDSVVRFEGELTLTELVENLGQPDNWSNILGLAFRRGPDVVVNPPRPLVTDLDRLPFIHRDEPQEVGLGVKMAAMLASRGCLFNCAFCSIRQFYGSSPGALRRVRSPQAVVAEMVGLYQSKGIQYFNFQDDDFAARTPRQREWLHQFMEAMDAAGLSKRVRWKISCRVDDLEPGILQAMQERGLMAVYLGVESGSEIGLRTLNKHTTVDQNVRAVDLLKGQNLALGIGFMLFDPSSTVDTIKANISFLRTVGGDGYFPINFCKMLPYAGTPIEAQLRAAGRLTGTVLAPGYSFLEPMLDWYELLVQGIFSRRNFNADGLAAILQQADMEWHLANAFHQLPPDPAYGTALRRIIAQSNLQAVDTLSNLLDAVVSRGADYLLEEKDTLAEIGEREWRAEMTAEVELTRLKVRMPLSSEWAKPRLAQDAELTLTVP